MSKADAKATGEQALALLDTVAKGTSGRWPRAVALLLRQALEEALRSHWTGSSQSLVGCSGKTQLLCLPDFVDESKRDMALQAHYVWEALSNATHIDAGYELGPTATELRSWASVVAALT